MIIRRLAYSQLEAWKSSDHRKPLIIRGARQVGKTTLVKEFATTYAHQIFLNLEKPGDRKVFDDFEDVNVLMEALSLRHSIPKSGLSDTLLFIDEIQESPKAIRLLRYFFEEVPQLHVVAAGSLLEFALGEVRSFPVGRVTYLYLSPFNFQEFLHAMHPSAIEQLASIPVAQYAHEVLLQLFHEYALIGGMPEVIRRYTENQSVSELVSVYEGIWATYQDDVVKYGGSKTQQQLLGWLMRTAHLYLDQRVKFQGFGNSNYKSREIGEALRKLDQARVIRLYYPTTTTEIPLKPDLKKSPRMQFLDTGLINHQLGIQADMLAIQDLSQAFKGALIPHLIIQELSSLDTFTAQLPNFWVREKLQSSAEVDLILQHQGRIIPVEFKSGKTGKLKSLMLLVDQLDHPYAVRMYAGKFTVEQHTTPSGKPFYLMNLPYYLGTQLRSYLDYFTENYL